MSKKEDKQKHKDKFVGKNGTGWWGVDPNVEKKFKGNYPTPENEKEY